MQLKEFQKARVFSFKSKKDKNLIFYYISLSKKNKENNYINGYIQCKFRKGVVIPNITDINIKKSFLSFYLKDKITIPYIFVQDFDVIE